MAFEPGTWTELPPPPDVEFEFTSDPSAARQARRAMSSIAGDGDPADDVMLATSELVSNVVRHTHGGGTLRAYVGDRLRLEVHDYDPTLPIPFAQRKHGGRGLGIIDRLSERWGALRTRYGKVVWADFRRS